ncbi:MAG: PepSY domain-containing protein [Defluviitaleaceae bacterium]|nr:PepSY domain-containing protein [Defluviitaleaceae bacterium]
MKGKIKTFLLCVLAIFLFGTAVYAEEQAQGQQEQAQETTEATGMSMEEMQKTIAQLTATVQSLLQQIAAHSQQTATQATAQPRPVATPRERQQVTASVPQLTFERAMQIALAEVGGGTVKDIEIDRLQGVQVYEVEVRFGGIEYDVYVNADTGVVERLKEDGRYNINATTAPCLTQATVAFARASQIALDEVGGDSIKDIELEHKRGNLTFEVEVRVGYDEYDIDICATTGEVLRVKLDD